MEHSGHKVQVGTLLPVHNWIHSTVTLLECACGDKQCKLTCQFTESFNGKERDWHGEKCMRTIASYEVIQSSQPQCCCGLYFSAAAADTVSAGFSLTTLLDCNRGKYWNCVDHLVKTSLIWKKLGCNEQQCHVKEYSDGTFGKRSSHFGTAYAYGPIQLYGDLSDFGAGVGLITIVCSGLFFYSWICFFRAHGGSVSEILLIIVPEVCERS